MERRWQKSQRRINDMGRKETSRESKGRNQRKARRMRGSGEQRDRQKGKKRGSGRGMPLFGLVWSFVNFLEW
eukprot:364592-Rhodomonas_salina.1